MTTQMLISNVFAIGIFVSLFFMFALWLDRAFPNKHKPTKVLEGFTFDIALGTLVFGIIVRIGDYIL